MRKFNQFKNASLSKVPRSTYDLSHEYLFTTKFGSINPNLFRVVSPGESFKLRDSTKMLSVPYFAPMFSKVEMKTRYFAVPIRKMIPYWEDFCTSSPTDNLEEPYTTVLDVFASAYYNQAPLVSGNLLVLDAISAGGLADLMGWPLLWSQLFTDIFHMSPQEAAMINAEAIAAGNSNGLSVEGTNYLTFLKYNLDYILSNYANASFDIDDASISNILQHLAVGLTTYDPETYEYSKPTELDMSCFFFQKLRLLPFMAYQKINFDWFMDMRFLDKQDDVVFEDFGLKGPYVSCVRTVTYDSETSGTQQIIRVLPFLLSRRVVDYGKDYFTTCSPEPQQGETLVIGPEKLDLMFDVDQVGASNVYGYPGTDSDVDTGDDGKLRLVMDNPNTSATDKQVLLGNVWAQVNESDAITPLKLRWQMALQRLLEVRNIGGYSRYTDFILGQYGIRVPDPYLQRTVYLGGYRTQLNTNTVVALADGSNEEGSSILADQAAYGYTTAGGPTISGRIANEHVVIMGINYIVPQNYYTQGLRTEFTDLHLLDYPHWQFAQVGEQPVYKKELFFGHQGCDIFGYNRRYSDKTDMRDEVHGEFLSTLEYWRTGRFFKNCPSLGSGFLPLRGTDGHNRVLAVDPEDAAPFRCAKYIHFEHTMAIPRVKN